MALWKITAKMSTNAPCKNKKQKIEKGMSVETSTMSSSNPLGMTREHPRLAQLFMSKYGVEIDPSRMTYSYFICDRID
ncbi:MAG: DUF6140 family protein [Paludibacteraceae bacterium]|nr:DUF6140 family protein [Paludibacteraceae bacterium]